FKHGQDISGGILEPCNLWSGVAMNPSRIGLRQAGVDLQAHAADMKTRFADIAKRLRQKKLTAANEAYQIEVEKLAKRTFHLPSSPTDQRALLQLIAAQHAAAGGGLLTAKFRDLEKFSDSDVASLLEELAALGLIPNREPQE